MLNSKVLLSKRNNDCNILIHRESLLFCGISYFNFSYWLFIFLIPPIKLYFLCLSHLLYPSLNFVSLSNSMSLFTKFHLFYIGCKIRGTNKIYIKGMFGWFFFNGMEWYHNHSNVWLGIFTLGCHTLWILIPFQSSRIAYPPTPVGTELFIQVIFIINLKSIFISTWIFT